MARVITVNDVLDGHVVLDIECLDRIYLNAYVPILQTSSQVVAFLSGHLGFPFRVVSRTRCRPLAAELTQPVLAGHLPYALT